MRSSRTLPGPLAAVSAASAAASSWRGPTSASISRRKCAASSGMSPRRSRSGGSAQRRTPPAGSRGRRGSCAALTSACRSRSVIATTRTRTRDLAGAADPPQPPGLQHAQQLRLQVQRQLADLVEHQRAARRLLEPAGPPRRRAGERAALVTEQLALRQLARQRAAVDGDERAARVRARARAGRARPAPCRCRSRRSPAPASPVGATSAARASDARSAGSSPMIASNADPRLASVSHAPVVGRRPLRLRARGSAQAPSPSQASPLAPISFFQIGARSFRRSIAARHASNAGARWADAAVIATAISPTASEPTR